MLKVFLVEDESLIREGLKNSIPWEQYGYQFVGDASDGEMALPLIRKTQPDVLITDIKMPFMDGLSLSRIVSNELPKTKIIIISGHDDFSYAKQAISIGVDQYLLKPITRLDMKNVLLEMKEKIAQDMQQIDYQMQYQMEMREYEQFSRRHFFERLLEGELSVEEIYEEALKLDIDLSCAEYNLLFFNLQESKEEKEMQQEEVLHYFLRNPEYVVFSWNIGCFGVLLKTEQGKAEILTQRCIENVSRICEKFDGKRNWYLAAGKPVERLSQLPNCYMQVNHYFAYRFILPEQHLFTEQTLSDYLHAQEEKNIQTVDSAKMNPEIIRDFLERGNSCEIHDFVENYLLGVKEALESRMFRDYMVLNIRFTTISFIENLGAKQEEYLSRLSTREWDMHLDISDVEPYVIEMIKVAMEIRSEKNESQSGTVLKRAIEYIEKNYTNEALSLNKVAEEVNVSANYLSSVFSQSMQKTFIEYVTTKRMEKAKKLLKSTDAPTSEISQTVGYKDAHYFSFVFKKTVGMSPREYRASK